VPYVYVLRCGDGSLYTGAAKDLGRRLSQHQAGTASKYTRARRPVTLAWSLAVRTWGRALQLEARIKQLPRADKLALVGGSFSLPTPRRRSVRRRRPRTREPRRRAGRV
jgi:putative endonuclease